MKRIALLGGTRFIGYHLLMNLFRQGHKVTIFNRGITQSPSPLPKEVELIVGDRNCPKDYQKLFCKEFDVVFDLSGYNENHILPVVQNYQSSIGHYIFCSTSSVYKATASGLLDEESPRDFSRNTYGGNKALAEELLLKACKAQNWPVTIFRPNGVFGPCDRGQPTYQAWLVFYRLINSLPISVINEKKFAFNLLYIDDLVNGFIHAMNNDISHGNIYGIAGDEVLTEQDFIKLCGEICSNDPEIHLVEDLGYDDIHYLHPWAKVDLVTDTTKIKTDLAISFTSINTSLSKTHSWLNQHPEHFGQPSFRGERYVLNRRFIPEYIKISWRLVDRAAFILHIKYYYIGPLAKVIVFWRFIKKWLRQRIVF